MRTETRTVVITTYRSDVHENVVAESEQGGSIIAWADANPIAWDIVLGRRSGSFGLGSDRYTGGVNGNPANGEIVERLRMFREWIRLDRGLTSWAAKHTVTLFANGVRDISTGYFEQHFLFDGEEHKGCCSTLDFTDDTRIEVIAAFADWSDQMGHEDTTRITIDGVDVINFVKFDTPVRRHGIVNRMKELKFL